MSAESETIDNLRRLSVAFERVEKLLTLAASLHRKFLQAPRLSREIFSDYYDFDISKMGKGLAGDIDEKVKCFYALKYTLLLALDNTIATKSCPIRWSQLHGSCNTIMSCHLSSKPLLIATYGLSNIPHKSIGLTCNSSLLFA